MDGPVIRSAVPGDSKRLLQIYAHYVVHTAITYEYDDDCNLHRQTIINTSSGLKVVNEFKYNDNGDITQQSKKVFDKQNECVMSINMKNSFEERDDTGNWTKNTLNLTYWETGQRAQMMKVDQTRTISYWDE